MYCVVLQEREAFALPAAMAGRGAGGGDGDGALGGTLGRERSDGGLHGAGGGLSFKPTYYRCV